MVEPVKKTGGSAPEKGMEGARRATRFPFSGAAAAESEPIDPEVPAKATRRKFTAQYKLDILAQAERCESGEVGALLRREGLYSSHLTTWRRQCEEGALAALTPRKRGRSVAEGLEQPPMVEPIDPSEGRQFDRLSVFPGLAVDHLRFVQTVDGLRQGVVIRISDAADRGLNTRLGQALGVTDRDVLHPSVAVVDQAPVALIWLDYPGHTTSNEIIREVEVVC